jgi:hypothetical protein
MPPVVQKPSVDEQLAELREKLVELDSHRVQSARLNGDLIKATGELSIASTANTRALQTLTAALSGFRMEQREQDARRDKRLERLERQVRKLFSKMKAA